MFRDKSQPSAMKVLFITLTTIFVILLTLSLTQNHHDIPLPIALPNPFSMPLPERGTISPILYSQNLSHGNFHSAFTKPYLLDLVTTDPSETVIIIGLAGGAEAIQMSRTHKVHAFEPMPHFVERFRERSKEVTRNVTLYPVAAAEDEGEIEVHYQGKVAKVPARRADGLLPSGTTAAVVSVDVQGAEFLALKGLGAVLKRTNSVWVEVGCMPGTSPLEMLEFLDREFVLFDYVSWGQKRGVDYMWDREQFFLGKGRPDGISEWTKWFCDARDGFNWLQTDVVGMRRSLLQQKGDKILKGLSELGERTCQEGCYLREALAKER